MKSSEEYVELAAEQMHKADTADSVPLSLKYEVRANFFARLATIAAIKEAGGTVFGRDAEVLE